MLPHTDATPLYEISLAIVEEEEKQGAREESRVEAEKQQQPAAAATASPTPRASHCTWHQMITLNRAYDLAQTQAKFGALAFEQRR